MLILLGVVSWGCSQAAWAAREGVVLGLLLVWAVVDGPNGVGGGVMAYVVVRLRLFGLLFGENDVWAAEEKKEVATEVNLHGLQAAILRRTGGYCGST